MTSDAIPAPMNETMTPSEAARILTDAAGFERALERRTAGITMMVWGIVSSAIFTTYGMASVLGANESPSVGWIYGTLWVPWVAAGLLVTMALWRSAALSTTREIVQQKDVAGYWLRSLGFTAAIALVFFLVHPNEPMFPLAILGGAFALTAVLNLFRSHIEERRYSFAAGAILLVVALAFRYSGAPIEITGTVSILAPIVVLVTLGLWQTLRG